jgi:hypothetical protein
MPFKGNGISNGSNGRHFALDGAKRQPIDWLIWRLVTRLLGLPPGRCMSAASFHADNGGHRGGAPLIRYYP